MNRQISRKFSGRILPSLMAACLPMSAMAEMPMAKNPPRLDVSVIRERSTKVEGGDWDDRSERVKMGIKVTNKELNASVEGLTAYFWVVARSAVDRKCYKIVQREEFPIALSNARDGRVLEHETKEIELRYDRTDAVFGESYHGWLLVITNDNGEIVWVKSTVPAFEKAVDTAMNLKTGAWVDSYLAPAKDPASS